MALAGMIWHLHGGDLPSSSGDASIWSARVGPDAIQDPLPAYGLPDHYQGPLLNGHRGLMWDRAQCPLLKAAAPVRLERGDYTFVVAYNPLDATATASTRGYLIGSTEDDTAQGTRLIIPHHANTSVHANFDVSGFYNNSEATVLGQPTAPQTAYEEACGVNHGWHRFYTPNFPTQVPLITAGMQVNVWVLGRQSYWMRNGVVMGYARPGVYREQMRSMAFKTVLGCDHSAAGGGNTTTFFHGALGEIRVYPVAATVAEGQAVSSAVASEWA